MASADWKVKIELDINDLRSELSGLEKEIDGLTKEKHKIELGIDTKTLDSAIKKLDNMLDNLGKGTGDFKQFEKLDQQITEAVTSIKEFQKAFGSIDNGSGAKSLLSSIQSIDTSLTNLSSSLSAINRELINTSDNTTDITVKLSSIQSAFSGIESSLSSMKKVFSDVGDGEEFSPLLNTINEVKNEINGLQSSIKGIGLNLNIDFGSDSEMEAKVQSKISNALQAYQRLYEHLRTSSGGKVATKSFMDFDIDQFTTSESKLQAYRKFIERTRNEVKLRSGGEDRLKLESDSKYWNEAAAAMGQVTKVFNEMKTSKDTSSLDGLFGKTDLTEVIGQLALITEKLQEISTVATNLSTKFDSGFNVTTSVEEITKLTEKVKILEDELSQLKTVSANQSSSTPSTESADLNKVQQAAQEAAIAKESFVSANEKVASSVDGSVSKLQEEANLFKQVAENAKTAAENKKAFTSANEDVASSGKKTDDEGKAGKADVTTDTNDLSASHSENRLPKNVKKYIKKGARTPSIDTGNHDNEITVSSVSDLGSALKKLQSEIIASIDESTSFVKEVTDFYDSNDNLLKSQLKVADKDGSTRTYTTSFNKNEDDSFTAWTSHIETQKFPDENKLKEDARQSKVDTALKDQINAYKEIQNIREKMSQTSDSNMLSELSKEKKEYQEQYLAASKILKANSDLYDSEKQLGELKKISTKTSNKIAQNQIKSNSKEQSQNDKYLSDKSKASFEKEAKLEEEIYNLRKKNIGAKKSEVVKNNELIKGKQKEIEQEQEYRKASGLDDKNEEAKNRLINKRTSLMKDLDTAQNAYNKSLRVEDQEAKSNFKKKAKESSSKITSALDEYKNASDESKKKASDLLDSISGFTYYGTEAKVNKSNVSSEVKRIQSETNEVIKALKTEHEKVQKEQEKLNKSKSSELQNSVQRQLNSNIDRYSTISKRMASGSALSTDAEELAKIKKEIETIQNSDILPADKLNASRDRIKEIDIAVDDLKKKLKEGTSDSAQSIIDKYQKQVNSSLKNSDTFKVSDGYKKAVNDLQSSITELDNFKKKIANQPMLSEDDLAEFERLKQKVEDASQALKNFSSSAKGMKGVSIEKEISKINQTLNQNPKYSKAAKEALHELLQELESGVSTKGLDEIHQKLLKIQNDEEKAGRSGKGLIDVIKEKQWYGFAAQIAGMFSFYDVINVFKEAASTVTQLNSDITDLAKVSEATTSQIYDDFSSYADIAKDIGGTISDTISATAAWAKNGYDIPDSKELARVSQLYKNVGDNIDIDAANESLISTLKGFQLEADQAEHIVDIFNEVSNNEAISSSGIGDALQRSAAAFNAANTSLEKSVALITATRQKELVEYMETYIENIFNCHRSLYYCIPQYRGNYYITV